MNALPAQAMPPCHTLCSPVSRLMTMIVSAYDVV